MITELRLDTLPTEHEAEKASNSYLMSLVALIGGLPLPIVNLIATFFFFVANRRGTYFVRWHCTQALLSQVSLIFVNGFGFWWTMSIIFGDRSWSNAYFAYIFTLLLFNLIEFIATVFSAVQTRKGIQVEWWLYGEITHRLVKP